MMKERWIKVLKELALIGAMDSYVTISSRALSKILGCSQQTASRYLIEMERMGCIDRKLGIRKQRVKIGEKGRELLQREYLDYKKIFNARRRDIFLKGKVISGLGEGKYYTTIDGYTEQFRKKLKFIPIPGTLNVRVNKDYLDRLMELKGYEGIRIEGFSTEDRSFGGARCFHAEINNLDAVVIIPDRTHYMDILEFISPFRLRDRLNLKDGDQVDVIIHLGDGDEESGDS